MTAKQTTIGLMEAAGSFGGLVLLKKIMRDRIAFVAAVVLIALYAMIAFADFLAPYNEDWNRREMANSPPTPVYMMDTQGNLTWPYVFAYERKFNPQTFDFRFVPNRDRQYPLRFLPQGEPYKLWGVIPSDIHLFGVDAPKDTAHIALLGLDMNGRDNFSRLFFGGQISLTIGFLGLFIAFPIGLIYGGISGYFGGWLDNLMMRFTEILMSIPSIYLLLALAAILPAKATSAERFTMVVAILAFMGWAGLARVIRGMVLSIKSQEFVEAGRAMGMGALPIIIKHILPQTASYVIVAVTLGVPGYILAESSLSFLGLGIQQPDASWGNMLKEAQVVTNLVNSPWMMAPGLLIFLAILSFNVLGDAVRDVLDPKRHLAR